MDSVGSVFFRQGALFMAKKKASKVCTQEALKTEAVKLWNAYFGCSDAGSHCPLTSH